MRLFKGIFIAATAILTACECPPGVDERFVQDIRQAYFADSVAEPSEPRIQFTYEVVTGTRSTDRSAKLCFGRKLLLGIRELNYVIADSCQVYCSRDLPGTAAGMDLRKNPYVDFIINRASSDSLQLRTFSLMSWWTVPDWSAMPDTATLKFRFRLNNGLVFVKERGIRFSP